MALAGLAVAAALLIVALRPAGHVDDNPRDRNEQAVMADSRGHEGPAALGGVAPARVDPANYIAAEHSTDPSRRAEFMLEADRATNLLDSDARWEPTLIDMDFSEAALDIYLECSKRHLRQPCAYEVEYVIEAKDPESGEVVFGRISMGTEHRDECEAYAKCTVKRHVGALVSVPPGATGLIAHRKAQTDNYAESTLDELEANLAIMEEGVAMMEASGPDGKPNWEYRLEVERSYLYLLRSRIAEAR